VKGRDRIVLLVLAGVAVVAGFWFMAISPKQTEAAKLGQDLSAQQQRLDTATGEIATSQSAQRDYGSNYATIARLGAAVPQDDDVPGLVYQLDTAARRSGVDFRSVKLNSTGGTATPAATTPAPGAPTAPKGAAPATPAAATQAVAATLPPGASVGPAGFPTMPFSLGFDGNFFHMSSFFGRLHAFVRGGADKLAVGGRLLTIDGISLTAGRHGFPQVKATVAATAYLVPADQGATAGASPAAPAGTTATPASASGSPSPAAPATATPPTR
jgi:hypothetical protein